METSCNCCLNCVYVGDGDFICELSQHAVMVDWEPTMYYGACDGCLQ